MDIFVAAKSISEKDRKLIALLRQNARRPVSEIAAILDTSRQTVQKRMDKLVAQNVIQRFTIDIDKDVDTEALAGLKVVFIMNLRQSACSRVFATIRHWPELDHCWSIAGDRDMFAIFYLQSQQEAEAMREKLSRHADVLTITTTHILRTWK